MSTSLLRFARLALRGQGVAAGLSARAPRLQPQAHAFCSGARGRASPQPREASMRSPGASATAPRAWSGVSDAFGVSCVRFHDLFALSNSLPSGGAVSLFDALRPKAVSGVRGVRLACVGDALVVLRGGVRNAVLRRVGRMRVVPGKYVRAAVGMAWAAGVAAEPRHASGSLLKMLCSAEGPRRIGIGCLSPFWRRVLAALVALVVGGGALYVGVWCAQGIVVVLLSGLLCFATRPDLGSFVAWVKDRAPAVARQKHLLVDRVRVLAAPYLMRFRPPVLYDFGLFSVVLLTDYAEFVYVYAGCMSRWCLLGWYNGADEYDFDVVGAKAF